ncbi:SLATT domain-containing protein [Candidatus Kapabacteria bacterium]|nr:SLATT domain-containing protein [Candidatus Kapabacteria bacterium]
MEQNFQADILEGQLRENFGRIVYSHKSHEKCADILNSNNSNLKIAKIVLSGLTTGGLIAIFANDDIIIKVISALLSTALLIINSYTKDYDLGEIAQKHASTAIDLWNIREKYLSLLTDLKTQRKTIEEIEKFRDEYQEDLFNIYNGAQRTTYKAYKKAQEALQNLDDMTFSDDEIDKFLPKELKKNDKDES